MEGRWKPLAEAREELCKEYGISPSTFHTWLSRYKDKLLKSDAIKIRKVGQKEEVSHINLEKFKYSYTKEFKKITNG